MMYVSLKSLLRITDAHQRSVGGERQRAAIGSELTMTSETLSDFGPCTTSNSDADFPTDEIV